MSRAVAWAEHRGRLPAVLAVALAAFVAACGGGEPGAPGAPSESAADRAEQRSAVGEGRPAARRDQGAGASGPTGRPVTLEIPAIGVRAPVIRLGLNEDRTLEVPTDYGDTGWWSGGFAPGQRGPAVIAGHVDSQDGPAVFHALDELQRGDRITVRRGDGSAAGFEVRRIERHPKDDFPTRSVYGPTPRSTLRLITCSGDFDESSGHYLDNTIVFATRAT